MKTTTMLVLLAALTAASPALGAARRPAAPPPTPQRGAMAFYTAYMMLHPSGIPAAGPRSRLMPFITERLYTMLQDGDRAEARYAEATKHEDPPLIEGDLFTSLFEGATSFAVGDCTTTGEMTAACKVNLTYKSDGQPDTNWTDTVELVREGRRYRVDDIAFGGTWPFANKGKLSDVIKDAVMDSQMPAN
jgi:hypothetical protein